MRRLIFLTALICLTGCGLDFLSLASMGPVGHYSLDMNRTLENMKSLGPAKTQEPQGNPEEIRKEAEAREQIMAALSTMKMTMILKEDGTWESSFSWGPLSQASTGTWEQREDKLLLTTNQKDGEALSQPEIEHAIYQGGEIYLTEDDISSALILTRSPT